MKIHWLMFTVLIVLSACKAGKEGTENMSVRDSAGKTHCVGRSLITLPSSFVEASVVTGIFKMDEAEGRSFDVIVQNGVPTIDRFNAEVQARRAKLKSWEDGNINNLRIDKEIGAGMHLFRVQEIEDAYVSELYLHSGESMVVVRLDSYRGTYLEAENNLIKISTLVHARNANNLHAQAGRFCLGGVSLAGNFKLESGSFLFRDGKGESYDVEINTYGPDDETPLLKRMSGSNSLLTIFNVNHKVLRARERAVAGMRAQEWLGSAKVTDEPDGKTLKFSLDSMRAKPSKTSPSISLTYDTAQPLEDGTPTQTIIPDDEAMRQWDAVIDSIRPADA
jgi:hypothetical protein